MTLHRLFSPFAFVAALVCMAGCASRDPGQMATPVESAATAAGSSPVVVAPAGLTDSGFADWLTAERERIAQERSALNQRFQAAELTCWHRFAVNDCLRQARAERRAGMDGLRRQELDLNAQERQRRTSARLQALEQKQKDN